MRKAVLTLGILAGITAMLALTAPSADALHSSSELICSKCHTMHNSEGGTAVVGKAQDYLLRNAVVSDLCFSCHDSAGTADAPVVYDSTTDTPGGDFDYVSTSALNGHNVISTTHAIAADTVTPSPGGSYVSADLTCTSCHYPHGSADYRNLNNSTTSSLYASTTFSAITAPTATGITVTETAYETTPEGDTNHNAYQSGFGAWCAACHSSIHSTSETATPYTLHPTAGTFAEGYASNYGTSYAALYPFEDADITSVTSTTGPDETNSKVFCLSCHRAHGTTNDSSTRWDMSAASGVGTGCNKCHGK